MFRILTISVLFLCIALSTQVLAQPDIEVTWNASDGYPDKIDFNLSNIIFVNTAYNLTFNVKNVGSSDLDIIDIEVEDAYFDPSPRTFSLPAGSAQSVSLTFESSDPEDLSQTLIIHSNDPDETEYSIDLHARSYLPPEICVDPHAIETEAETGSYTIEEFAVNIGNDGDATLRFNTNIEYITSPHAPPVFSEWAECEPTEGDIEADDEMELIVSLITRCGMGLGLYEAELHIRSNDPDDPDVVVNITLHITASAEYRDILALMDYLSDLRDEGRITTGMYHPWSNFLEFALKSLIKCDLDNAIHWLEFFIDKVRKEIERDHPRIPVILGDELITMAQDIIDDLGDGDANGPAVELTSPGYIPSDFCLVQSHPNPFNSAITITYKLPAVSDVSLKIFDIAGREVTTLVRGRMETGVHQIVWNGAGAPSGIYICRLTVGKYARHQKLALVR